MNRINIKKLGFAVGLTAAIFYLGCMIVMLATGQEGTIKFFNSLLHGLDVTSVIRPSVPLLEALIGIVLTFSIGWLIGAFIAFFYNLQHKQKS